jgi:hypothetical protein
MLNQPYLPTYILVGFAVLLCIWAFWVGTVCVRLWFYRGALGPEPEKFIIIPHDRRKLLKKVAPPKSVVHNKHSRRHTQLPHEAHINHPIADPFADNTYPVVEHFAGAPVINIEGTESDDEKDDYADYADPGMVRKLISEERRISRLPAFEQDDCGDGSNFANVPYALDPVEEELGRMDPLSPTSIGYEELGLTKLPVRDWITFDVGAYKRFQLARVSLLSTHHDECVQVRREGEDACMELMDTVCQALHWKYQEHFHVHHPPGEKYIYNSVYGEKFSLLKPLEYQPIEICARLTGEDYNVFVRSESTRQWYLYVPVPPFPSFDIRSANAVQTSHRHHLPRRSPHAQSHWEIPPSNPQRHIHRIPLGRSVPIPYLPSLI